MVALGLHICIVHVIKAKYGLCTSVYTLQLKFSTTLRDLHTKLLLPSKFMHFISRFFS
jgi:hypothetical protein